MTERIAVPEGTDWIQRIKQKSRDNMFHNHGCTQCILEAFMDEFGIEDRLVVRSAGALHAGLFSSLTCGVHIAGLMVLGLLIGRDRVDQGLDGLFPIVMPAQNLVRRLNEKLGSPSCRELTGVDFTDLEAAMKFNMSKDREKCCDYVGDGAEEIALFIQELDRKEELFRPLEDA